MIKITIAAARRRAREPIDLVGGQPLLRDGLLAAAIETRVACIHVKVPRKGLTVRARQRQ